MQESIFVITPALVLLPNSSSAGTIWDGGGGDDNWGTGANWNDDLAPTFGPLVDLTFAGTTRLSPFNNYTAFDDFHSLIFDATAGSFSLTGSALDIFGKIENYSTNAQTVGFDLAVNAGQTSTGEFNPVNGDLNINSANVFTNGNTLHVYGTNNKTVTFSATTVISQAGHFNVEQASNVVFLGNNTYSGTTNVLAGSLTVGGGGTTGALGAGTVTVATGASLTYNRSDAVTLGQTLNIGGTNPGEFDKVAGITNLTLDGTFTVSLFGGFNPVPGNSFDVLDWSGTLDATAFTVGTDLILPGLALDYTWDTTNFTTDGTLAVVPEPGSAALLLGGLAMLAGRRRKQS